MWGSNGLTRLLFGITFGFVAASVCMVVLPTVFMRRGLYVGLVAVLVGVVLPEGLRRITRRKGLPDEPVWYKWTRSCLWLTVSVGLCVAARFALHGMPGVILDLLLGCAGGVLLCVSCGYMLPDEELGMGKRRVPAILGAILGFALGAWLIT